MKVFLLLLLFLANKAETLHLKFQFLKDFFANKHVMLTVYSREKQDTIKPFLVDMSHLDNLIGVQCYGNSSNQQTHMFNNLSPRNWYVIDIQSYEVVSELLFDMNKTNSFRFPLKHLFIINIYQYDDFLESLCKCNILAASETFVASLNNTNIEIFEIYKIGSASQCSSVHFGNWSKGKGVTYLSLNMPLARRRKNFQKHEVVILAVANSNKSFLTNFDDPPPTSFDEPFFLENAPNIMNMINYLNASHVFRQYKVFGHLNQTTGKFYGMVNDLAQGIGDLAGSGLFVSEERQRIIDYVGIATTWGCKIIFKKPSMSYAENIYLMTFTGRVWIASLIVLITFGLALYILLNWEKQNLMNGGVNEKVKYSVSDATLLSFEALCQQGTTLESATISGRMLLIFLFTAFMFLYAAYSGYILVLLQSTKPIVSVQKLLDSRLECGGINISFMMDWYNVNKNPALKALYNRKLRNNRFLTLENGLARVREGNFAFHTALSISYIHILKTFTNHDICKLQELPGYLSINNAMYFGVPKTSQYKEFFKVSFMRTKEAGLAIRNKYKQSRKPKCYNEGANFQSVGIYDCYTIIIFFLVGSFLSVFVLAIEVATHKYSENLKKKYVYLTTRHR